MSLPLPVKKIKWVENVNSFHMINHLKDIDKGYILEVDLKYPKELHESHNAYQLAR